MTRSRIIIGLVAIGFVVLLLLWGPAACRSYFNAKQEARVQKGQAGAAIDAGAEAMNTVSNVAAAQAETEKTVKEAVNEIRTAPAGNSNAAAERAACRLRQYRDSERCARLRAADTAKPSGAHTPR